MLAVSLILIASQSIMGADKKVIDEITLESGSKIYRANSVYQSKLPRNGWDFTGLTADDTIHTMEGRPFEPINCQPGEAFKVKMDWQPGALTRCNFYLGDPGQMHADGYKSVVKLAFTGGTVLLPKKLKASDYLLLVMIKPRVGDYLKFVFVIHSGGNAKAAK